MTSTGRATLFLGVLSAGTWLYNNHKDRQAASDLQAKARVYQNYRDAKKDYSSQPFYKKGGKPQWDETKWSDWYKTK
jgi:hypothetical protein